jgi:hypothetical protein
MLAATEVMMPVVVAALPLVFPDKGSNWKVELFAWIRLKAINPEVPNIA